MACIYRFITQLNWTSCLCLPSSFFFSIFVITYWFCYNIVYSLLEITWDYSRKRRKRSNVRLELSLYFCTVGLIKAPLQLWLNSHYVLWKFSHEKDKPLHFSHKSRSLWKHFITQMLPVVFKLLKKGILILSDYLNIVEHQDRSE
jgi:hypothetical protein